MSAQYNGGPAFPSTSYWDCRVEAYRPPETDGGMTLRDYFAAKAVASIWKHLMESLDGSGQQLDGCTSAEVAAKVAYEIANAMLKARQA